MSRPLNIVQAADGRDAFVKVLVHTSSRFKDWGSFQSCLSYWLSSLMWQTFTQRALVPHRFQA